MLHPSLTMSVVPLLLAGASQAQVRVDRLADTTSPSTLFGWACALDGDRLTVQVNKTISGGIAQWIYSYRDTGADWELEAQNQVTVVPGGSDKPMALDGNRAVMIDLDGTYAHVLEFDGVNWVETALLETDDPDGLSSISDVALEGDRIALGDRGDSELGVFAGAVFVYELQAGSWVRDAKLLAVNGNGLDNLGSSIAMEDDRIVAGAPDRTYGTHSGTGRLYVFEKSGSTWGQTAQIDANFSLTRLGREVALQGDRIFASTERQLVGEQVNEYTLGTNGWQRTEQVRPIQGVGFGYDLEVDGDLLICSGDLFAAYGGLHVYRDDGMSWQPVTQIQLSADWLSPSSPLTGFGRDAAVQGGLVLTAANSSWIPGAPASLGSRGNAWVLDVSALPTIPASWARAYGPVTRPAPSGF